MTSVTLKWSARLSIFYSIGIFRLIFWEYDWLFRNHLGDGFLIRDSRKTFSNSFSNSKNENMSYFLCIRVKIGHRRKMAHRLNKYQMPLRSVISNFTVSWKESCFEIVLLYWNLVGFSEFWEKISKNILKFLFTDL